MSDDQERSLRLAKANRERVATSIFEDHIKHPARHHDEPDNRDYKGPICLQHAWRLRRRSDRDRCVISMQKYSSQDERHRYPPMPTAITVNQASCCIAAK